jgi:hypothetical protein
MENGKTNKQKKSFGQGPPPAAQWKTEKPMERAMENGKTNKQKKSFGRGPPRPQLARALLTVDRHGSNKFFSKLKIFIIQRLFFWM